MLTQVLSKLHASSSYVVSATLDVILGSMSQIIKSTVTSKHKRLCEDFLGSALPGPVAPDKRANFLG